ncbi:hypothetical protein GQ53DRAFT_421488 [Thozetella sp. PMI_491]|nr:hypothetical protein GQ53DRAFT_421488 [Thozetella sp. PMI_491]
MRFQMSWPLEKELGHEWYEMLYTHLYVRVHKVAEQYFKLGDLPKVRHWDSLWTHQKFSDQFLYYAGVIARGDKKTGGWEEMLKSELHRQYLIMGVIGKVLETTVFSELLFGATEEQSKLLKSQDTTMVMLEGYSRTYMRSNTIRALLRDDLLPPLFWDEVDKLSMQMVALLLPVVKLLDAHLPQSRQNSLRALHQDLHHIVAEAGYLSVGIRWSRSIFRFRTPLPGETNDDREQQHIDEAIYKSSKVMADKQDSFLQWRWLKDRAKATKATNTTTEKTGEEPVTEEPTPNCREPAAIQEHSTAVPTPTPAKKFLSRTPGSKQKKEPFFMAPSRMAKVQIVLWPSLQRFSAGGPLGQSNIDPATSSAEGSYETWLFKAAVVYYLGRLGSQYELQEAHPALHEHVSRAHWNRLWRRGPSKALLRELVPRLPEGMLLAAAIYMVAYLLVSTYAKGRLPEDAEEIYDEMDQRVRYFLAGSVGLFLFKCLITVISALWSAMRR